MNIYDTANKLAYEIKNSEDYKNFKELKEEIKQDAEVYSKIQAFEKLRYEVQLASLQGGAQENEKAAELQKMYIEIIENEKVSEYFEAEMKFNVILADVNKIIGEAVEDVLK